MTPDPQEPVGRLDLLRAQAIQNDQKIVLLILDGLGDIRSSDQPRTALEQARTPNFDELARRSALGRITPASAGITPGSGPGHLSLFGYDPLAPAFDIGRGVLEALGLGLELHPHTIAARGNFASIDGDGKLTDRRAGRIPTEEGQRLCARLAEALENIDTGDLSVRVAAGEGYRFVLLFDCSCALDPGLEDTDPQALGVPPKKLQPTRSDAAETASKIQPILDELAQVLADEPKANSFLLRGFSVPPQVPTFGDLYQLRSAAIAGYPLYRGVASVCGMQVIETGKRIADLIGTAQEHWNDFDFFFLHVKQTDQAGEDGDIATKVQVIEEVDRELPRLLELEPSVLAVTGDHSTPAPMKAHSWHPVPLLLHGPYCGIDGNERFTEIHAIRGGVGDLPSADLMGLLLANAGRLAKYGA